MSNTGRLLASFFLALCLVSCETVETGELVGLWQDEEAALVTCGDSFTLAIKLDIREDGDALRGTFSTGDTDFPFVGLRTGRIINGDVNDAEKEVSLVAVLAYSSDTLRGDFEATEASDCAAGGTSKTVYKVAMTRSTESTEMLKRDP